MKFILIKPLLLIIFLQSSVSYGWGYNDEDIYLGYGYTFHMNGTNYLTHYIEGDEFAERTIDSYIFEREIIDYQNLLALQWDINSKKLYFWIVQMKDNKSARFNDLDSLKAYCKKQSIPLNGFPSKLAETPMY